VADHDLYIYYPFSFLYDSRCSDRLALWNTMSAYNVSKSKFYEEGYQALMSECFDWVLSYLGEVFEAHRMRMEDFFSFGYYTTFQWYPFNRALFFDWLGQRDRTVTMPWQETYHCKANRWTANVVVRDTGRKDLVGYVIKKTEACLRQALKYKNRITANTGAPAFELKKIGISFDIFEKAIEKAVSDFYRGMTQTVVSVDRENLARIRKEALGTQAKLTVPETDLPRAILVPGPDRTESANQLHVQEEGGMPHPASTGWGALRSALTETELKALSVLLKIDENAGKGNGANAENVDSYAGIKSFADKNGIMLEVLLDGINEKSADHIGDSILDTNDEIGIYDDYRNLVADMIRRV
jgi:hypothetical protein